MAHGQAEPSAAQESVEIDQKVNFPYPSLGLGFRVSQVDKIVCQD